MHKGIMHEEDEGTEGKETYCQKTDRGSQLPPYIDPADHIHHEENQKQRTDGSEEIGTQVVKCRILHAVHRVNQHIRKYQDPGKERNVSDAPERMEQIFPVMSSVKKIRRKHSPIFLPNRYH